MPRGSGRNDLLRQIFSAAESWRDLSEWLLGVVGAVARIPCEGTDARQRVEFLAVIAGELTKLRNSLEACDIALTPEIYASLLRRTSRRCASPMRANRSKGFRSWASSKRATSISTT